MADVNKPAKPAEKKPGAFARFKKFLKDTRSEVKKVTWPGKQQVINNTGIVIACLCVMGVIIGLMDAFFTFGLQLLLKLA